LVSFGLSDATATFHYELCIHYKRMTSPASGDAETAATITITTKNNNN
jgi:hypothetical protein